MLIPAARPDVLHEGNVDDVKAKLVIEGANIPAAGHAERPHHDRDELQSP